MYGFGSPAALSVQLGSLQTPSETLGPDGNKLPVSLDYFDWGFGAPEPYQDYSVFPGWTTQKHTGMGNLPTVEGTHATLSGSKVLPDDGGEIITILAQWSNIGPYTIKCKNVATNQFFPLANSPLPFCNSPAPHLREKCYTNVLDDLVSGVPLPIPGTQLKFVLPVLPPGTYHIEITHKDGVTLTTLENAFEVVWRNRSREVYAIRNRWSKFFEAGQRILRFESLVGYDSASEETI